MSYDNNENEMENNAPKKADVLIKRTQDIVAMQEELSEQTQIAISKINEAVELCNKNSQDASNILEYSNGMFEKLQKENSALKQELLYLAKQSENIYAGLAEKLNELHEAVPHTDMPVHPEDSLGAGYYELADRLTELSDRLVDLSARVDALSTATDMSDDEALNEKFAILYDKIDAVSADTVKSLPRHQSDGISEELSDRLNRVMELLRKNEGAHSMLADKFEILSMRVEQFGYESAKVQPASVAQPQPAPQPVMPYPVSVPPAEIDYDKLAEKVAEMLSVREALSPDLIASKVAEQIVLPDMDMPVAEVDSKEIAREVASLIDVKSAVMEAEAEKQQPAPLDSDALVERIAERMGGIVEEAKQEPINEDEFVEKIAERMNGIVEEAKQEPINEDEFVEKIAERMNGIVQEVKQEPLNGEELAERIAEKINTVNAEGAVNIDEEVLAERIAERLNTVSDSESAVSAASAVDIDEESLAERIAEKLSVTAETEEAPASFEIDDDALVEKIVSRLGGMFTASNTANAEINIDQEDLADAIALKVGSLKPEDFEILVDDAGCASISKEIAEKLDYHGIAEVIADKIREILDLNAANAPDYEDMAERISEKITVAGVNEDAIAEKAAAVLSNYLPEFDTEEIADKVTGAVIDVVSAMPQPALDSEAICNEISERLIERQEDNNYDIVVDEDGISRITAIVTEEIGKSTDARFDKLEESIAKLSEMLEPEEVEEEETAEEEYAEEEVAEEAEEEVSISEIVAEELEKGVSPRFDKVDEDIARIYELVSGIVVEETEEEISDGEEYAETEEYADDADYSKLSEIVATEIEKGVTARLDSVEEKLNSLTDILTPEEEEEIAEEYSEDAEEETAEEEVYEGEEVAEEDYIRLSEIVEQLENNLSSRFDGVEEKINSLTDLLTAEEETEEEAEEEYSEEEDGGESGEFTEAEEDGEYARLSEIVSARFDSVEEKINNLTDMLISVDGDAEEYEETGEADEEDYTKLSEIVATEIERGVTARLDSVEENIRKINSIVGGLAVAGVAVAGGRSVETDIKLYEQFDRVSEDIKRIAQYVEGDVPVVANERMDRIAEEISKISQMVEGELSVETNARLDKLQEEIEKLTVLLGGTVENEDSERLERVEGGVDEIKGMLIGGAIMQSNETAAAQTAEAEEEAEELVTVSDLVKPIGIIDSAIETEDSDDDGDFLLSAIDMDKFSDDEAMPGELSDLENGVDFENMMKFNRSFIARIIQSDDDCKQYYGEVKHALLSYKKVNSNVAWSNERFNKGRETIARMKIRGKTLVIYLALDPNDYKTSVYHHADVSDNKTVLGTPMMIKVKSPLGVRKAIRLIDEMLAKRDGEKRDVPERDYAAMYPYETIEELIEDGLVKDVRKK